MSVLDGKLRNDAVARIGRNASFGVCDVRLSEHAEEPRRNEQSDPGSRAFSDPNRSAFASGEITAWILFFGVWFCAGSSFARSFF